jgi:hypothetical protein
MILSVCTNPQPRPILASVIFISFILLCGFILVSLTVASVTSGINERLKDLEIEEGEQEPAEGLGAKKSEQVKASSTNEPPTAEAAPINRSLSLRRFNKMVS